MHQQANSGLSSQTEGIGVNRMLNNMLLLALAGMLAFGPVVMAASQTVFGIIQDIDVQNGTMTIATADEEIQKLRASPEQLENLQEGDRVEAEVEDGIVRRIRKIKQS